MSKFSEKLKELRVSRSLSQQQLADYLHTSKSSVNMYERGEREPGLEMLECIADYFNVDMDYLLGKSEVANKTLSNYPAPLLSEHEVEVALAYRNHPEEQPAIDKLLGISEHGATAPIRPNIIRKDIDAFGGAETLTVDSKALDAAIEKALKAKGLI